MTDRTQDCPPQDWPHGGQSWGGQFWVLSVIGIAHLNHNPIFVLSLFDMALGCVLQPCDVYLNTTTLTVFWRKKYFFLFCDVFRHCRCHLHHDHHHHEVEELQRLIVYSGQIIIQLCHQSHNHCPGHENHHVGEIMKSVRSLSAHFPFLSPFNFYFLFWLFQLNKNTGREQLR